MIGIEDEKKWFRLAAAILASSILANEKRIQRKLTKLPDVYHQDTTKNTELVSLLSSVLLRKLRPSLFIGTRSILNTIYGSLPSRIYNSNRFREVVKVSFDGAEIGLDWEIPSSYSLNDDMTALLNGPIRIPVVLVLHGVYNDTSNGYVRTMMHSCTERGYIAVGMNSRGSGGIKLTTPRAHNASYTNDLRDVINRICCRLDKDTPLVLVGYSMGANTLVKYLGECGLSTTLPKNIIGAVSLGNPMKINDEYIQKPWEDILRISAKKAIFQHRNEIRNCPYFKENFYKALLASTLPEVISISTQRMIRNNPSYPFETRIGYDSVHQYWDEASCYKYIAHVSVPLIVTYASDDDIACTSTTKYMNFGLSNPNVIFVNTATGGHLGWHHAMRNNPFGSMFYSNGKDSKSWENRLVSKFVDVILAKKFHEKTVQKKQTERGILKQASFRQQELMKSKL